MASTDAGRRLAPERWPLPSPRRCAGRQHTSRSPNFAHGGFATWIGLLRLSVAPAQQPLFTRGCMTLWLCSLSGWCDAP
jgi:hypothetical protein